jgi:hypothetical protein
VAAVFVVVVVVVAGAVAVAERLDEFTQRPRRPPFSIIAHILRPGWKTDAIILLIGPEAALAICALFSQPARLLLLLLIASSEPLEHLEVDIFHIGTDQARRTENQH